MSDRHNSKRNYLMTFGSVPHYFIQMDNYYPVMKLLYRRRRNKNRAFGQSKIQL